jgi:chromate transporter
MPAQPGMMTATLRTALIWAAIWLLPLVLLGLAEGGILFEIGVFFSKLAVLTFGGAYAVLAWMTQAVVAEKGWLTLPQMIDGLGLAETTPGPLILVTEFVGFMAAHREGGMLWGIAGAVVTLWVTFVPCFLWIFAGAPWIDRINAAPRLAGALTGITAAVVGVIANLGLWFSFHVLFHTVGTVALGPLRLISPEWTSLDPIALLLAIAAGVMILRLHMGLPLVLAICAIASAGLSLI